VKVFFSLSREDEHHTSSKDEGLFLTVSVHELVINADRIVQDPSKPVDHQGSSFIHPIQTYGIHMKFETPTETSQMFGGQPLHFRSPGLHGARLRQAHSPRPYSVARHAVAAVTATHHPQRTGVASPAVAARPCHSLQSPRRLQPQEVYEMQHPRRWGWDGWDFLNDGGGLGLGVLEVERG